MAGRKRMPWFKLHDDLWTTPSHAECDGDDLWICTTIMSFVRAAVDSAGDWTPWATLPSGKPVSVEAIAQKARKPVSIVKKAIAKLVDAGTVQVRSDGAIGLDGFRRHNEGESTERSQQSRERKAEAVRTAPIRIATEMTDEQRRVAVELEVVRQGLTYGWSGHAPPRPRGLRPLRLFRGVNEILQSGWSGAQLLAAVDDIAALVEAGEIPTTDWTSTKVFSGWIDTMLAKHDEWIAKRERKARALEPTPANDDGPAVSAAFVEAQTSELLARIGR